MHDRPMREQVSYLSTNTGGGIFANGAQTAAFLQMFRSAADYFESEVGGRATLRPGENRPGKAAYRFDPETGQQFRQDRAVNAIGLNRQLGSTPGIKGAALDFITQGGPLSRALNFFPGFSGAFARTHDFGLNSRKTRGLNVTEFNNISTMLPTAAIGYGAIIGQPLQVLSFDQLVNFSASNSFDRDDDRRYVYGAAAVGGR